MISSELTVPLSVNYSRGAVWAFHMHSDHYTHTSGTVELLVRKAFLAEGTPCLFEASIDQTQARCRLIMPTPSTLQSNFLRQLTNRILGLWYSVEPFETTALAHPQLQDVIRRQRGLVVPLTATPFEALSWAILAQRCHPTIAAAYRHRLTRYAGVAHPLGTQCHPDAVRIANLSPREFGVMGVPATVAKPLSSISELVASGHLQLDVGQRSLESVRKSLAAIPFIGSWTINYTLMYGCGDLDCSWHNDSRLRRSLGSLLGYSGPAPRKEAALWLEQFTPWRSLVTTHLWDHRSKPLPAHNGANR